MKAARVEKQLYDVIALLLSTAIHEYNLYHLVVMDTICKLNGKFYSISKMRNTVGKTSNAYKHTEKTITSNN